MCMAEKSLAACCSLHDFSVLDPIDLLRIGLVQHLICPYTELCHMRGFFERTRPANSQYSVAMFQLMLCRSHAETAHSGEWL